MQLLMFLSRTFMYYILYIIYYLLNIIHYISAWCLFLIMQLLMFLSRTFIAAHFPHQVIFLRISWILDIGYRNVLDISESILDCETFLKLASHNYTSTFQCILGFFTGLLIVRCLYKSPTWLNCSRLDNFHSNISQTCCCSGPSW